MPYHFFRSTIIKRDNGQISLLNIEKSWDCRFSFDFFKIALPRSNLISFDNTFVAQPVQKHNGILSRRGLNLTGIKYCYGFQGWIGSPIFNLFNWPSSLTNYSILWTLQKTAWMTCNFPSYSCTNLDKSNLLNIFDYHE